MNNQTADGEPTRYFILNKMLKYLEENEPTQEWKEEYIEFVEDTVYVFLSPELVSPWIQDKAFRKLVNETSVLAKYLYSQIHNQYTFDTEVFRIIGNHFLQICNICVEENNLVDSMQKMDCK